MTMTKEEIYNEIKKYVEENRGFMKYTNMHLDDVLDNIVKISVKISEDALNPYNFVHGGLIYALADSAMGMCALANGKKSVTINANINYLKPTIGTTLHAVARPIKEGKNISHYEALIYNDKEELTAIANGTYYSLKK